MRRLTPTECERLQGFPDGWTLVDDRTADGPRYKALGNAVTVPVIEYLGRRILAAIGAGSMVNELFWQIPIILVGLLMLSLACVVVLTLALSAMAKYVLYPMPMLTSPSTLATAYSVSLAASIHILQARMSTLLFLAAGM